MGERSNTIAGPGWEDLHEPEPVKPLEQQPEKPKTEEEIKAATLEARSVGVSGFLEGFKESRTEDLEREKARLDEMLKKDPGKKSKRTKSKETRVRLLEEEINSMRGALDSLQKKDIKPGLDIIEEIIDGQVEKFKELPSAGISPVDERIFLYIKNTVDSIAKKSNEGAFLPENEKNVLKNYLRVVKGKTKSDERRSEFEELEKQIKALKPEAHLKPERIKRKRKAKGEEKKAETPEASETIAQEGDTIETKKPAEQPEEEAQPEFREHTYEYILGTTNDLIEELFPELKGKKIEVGSMPEILKDLNKKKEEIEAQLSRETDENVKKELLEKKRDVCMGIIELASEREKKDIKDEIKQEEQRQFEISVAASGYKSMENYNRINRDRYYDEIIEKSSLSEEQKKVLRAEGEIIVSNWPSTIILSKEETATCVRMGLDINQIKRAGYIGWFSKKITAGKNFSFEDIKDFNNRISKSEEKRKIDDEIQQRIKQKREDIIDKTITDFVINKKVAEIMDSLADEEINKKWEPSVLEFSENPEEKRELIVETPEDRLQRLNSLRDSWNQANKIFKALKEGRKIKVQEGEILDPKNEEQRKELEDAKNFLSDEVINIAGRISGRKLREGFWMSKKIDPKNPSEFEKEKYRDELRKYLTGEVQKIYENSMEELKRVAKISGKKNNA